MEEKIARIREEIAQLKKNKKIADLLTLFREKGEIQKLSDFELDNPGCIWHYFYHVSLDLGFRKKGMSQLLSDVREIAIQIMDNPPKNIYNIIRRAGMYESSKPRYKDGNPEREQHVWHMLLWFFAESKSGIIDAIVWRMVRLCSTSEEGLLPYHDEMKRQLTEQEPIPVEEQEEQLPPEVKRILSLKGQENAKKLHTAIKQIEYKKKVDYLFLELVLTNSKYIYAHDEHTAFIEALEAWGIITGPKPTRNDLTVKLNQLGSEEPNDKWTVKDKNKYNNYMDTIKQHMG